MKELISTRQKIPTVKALNNIRPTPNRNGPLIVFAAFLAYYLATAMMLPYSAGPDHTAHIDGATFIFDQGRLAVLPQDEEQLHFTVYGSTRALRPPLSYITAAIAARVLGWTGIDTRLLFRVGPALLCALTVGLIFAALRRYFNNTWFAIGGALLAGLMPQFTFIASHLNDDCAAIFSVTLTLYFLVRLLHEKLTPVLAGAIGIAIGLVILSKFTAWLFLPSAGLALLAFARPQSKHWLPCLALFVIGAVVGGIWWIGFNVFHYGWNDPLAFHISAQTSAGHIRIDPDSVRKFADEGISLAHLVLGNYKGFVDETLISTIGNLDKLRLRLGLPQYLLYSLVLLLGAIYLPLRWLSILWTRFLGGASHQARESLFETLLLGAVVFQFFMYARYNLNQEAQIQGKYLLPVLSCSLLLFFSATEKVGRWRWLRQHMPLLTFGATLGGTRISLTPILMVSVIILVHADALARFVVPFYDPPAMALRLGGLRVLNLQNDMLIDDTRNLELQVTDDGWEIHTLTADSQIIFKPRLCDFFQANNLVLLQMHSDTAGMLQLFWDSGENFVAGEGISSTTARIQPGENVLALTAGIGDCKRIRIDPTNEVDRDIVIRSLAVAPLSISRQPFKIQ